MNPVQTAEIISVGTELLLGEIVDTNSAWLASRLAERGVDVYRSQRVGDNRERIRDVLDRALERSDLVLLTGGLGPTDDDLTREAIAATIGEAPEVDAGLEATLRARFASFARHMPEKNLKQAWLIPSAQALENPIGTAPGWLVHTERQGRQRTVVALPGPPRELERMWREQVAARLRFPEAGLSLILYKTTGLGESALAERLAELTLAANPSVATYAKRDGVHVRVAAKADTNSAAEALAAPIRATVEQRLAGHIWGCDDDELPQLLLARLEALGHTLASAEAAGGGLLSTVLSEAQAARSPVPASGRHQTYRGGVIAWSPDAMATLGVPFGWSQQHTKRSSELVTSMAEAARKLFAADYGIATGELEAEEDDAAAGSRSTAYSVALALAGPAGGMVKTLKLPALGAAWLRERIGFLALHLLWSHVGDIP